ncbi:hypothetical protein [Streptomyces sp. DH10]|uniref:hypothetical protein n=1 Tax=Streptomyces sp. DH10 TaxID=3040121 RepID=UPI002442E3C9|nr:hypothetical protein [Streptomyces sp. DH10]MDG9711142.1 hypothetical protein [Streptomyces sp. DH10]
MQNVTNGETPEFLCDTCHDYGSLEVFHPSTDAFLFSVKCDYCPMLSQGVYAKRLDWRGVKGLWKPTAKEVAEQPPF